MVLLELDPGQPEESQRGYGERAGGNQQPGTDGEVVGEVAVQEISFLPDDTGQSQKRAPGVRFRVLNWVY